MATQPHTIPAARARKVRTAPNIGLGRREIGDLIEALLLRLDALDGDPDAEPDADSELEPEAPETVLVPFLVDAPNSSVLLWRA